MERGYEIKCAECDYRLLLFTPQPMQQDFKGTQSC